MIEVKAWDEIRAWRSSMRKTLLDSRTAMTPGARKAIGIRAKQHLLTAVQWPRSAVLGIYWPIRGEIDVLDIARQHIDAGGTVALPVVTHRNAAVEFWRWHPLARMQRGFWNIPVPADPEPVCPDLLIVPLVGHDAAGYRLGYGGGYYDRTLAALDPRPLRVGLGYAEAVLDTIHPQPHDIPMSFIVTEAGVRQARS